MVTDAGNQGQLPWLATLVTKVTTMVTTMVTMMVTTMVTTMVTITNLGYRGCVTDYYMFVSFLGKLLNLKGLKISLFLYVLQSGPI